MFKDGNKRFFISFISSNSAAMSLPFDFPGIDCKQSIVYKFKYQILPTDFLFCISLASFFLLSIYPKNTISNLVSIAKSNRMLTACRHKSKALAF